MSTPRKHARASAKSQADVCKTIDLGLEGFSECPLIGPNACSFAMPFGYGYLCQHGNRKKDSARPQTRPFSGHARRDRGPA
jgi:hypothetical protein